MLAGGYFWHPLANGDGYNFWSGPLADLGLITIFTGLVFFIAAWWRKHNCHVQRCWRLQWHAHPGHGHPVCAKHHPFGQGRGSHLKPEYHTKQVHASWQGQAFAAASTMQVTGTATGMDNVSVVVGEVYVEEPPEKPKKQRVRKPGTEAVTDITKKKTDG